MSRFTPEVESMLLSAGWHSGRDISDNVKGWAQQLDQSKGFQLFPKAAEALREFGGLTVGTGGRGISRARTTVTLNPLLADGEEDRFSDYEAAAGARLYPLGEIENGNYFLAISEDGAVFLVMDDMVPVAGTFEEALTKLLLGIR